MYLLDSLELGVSIDAIIYTSVKGCRVEDPKVRCMEVSKYQLSSI